MNKGTMTKESIIAKNKQHEKDSGSPEVQISVFNLKIKNLADHLKFHPKDVDSKKGLLQLIGKKKKLLRYFKSKFPTRYEKYDQQ
ncbi:MAG: 30S ribosomal protein S15 [Candidatus Pacebacteria bacterium]|nr:30S ribosomal protein S15 [Candidatus Paceibacterota bacterium]